MKFTIFGSSGFIGSNLKPYLISCGNEVFCPDRKEIIDTKNNLNTREANLKAYVLKKDEEIKIIE